MTTTYSKVDGKWHRIEESHYTTRTGERERIDVRGFYNGFLCRNYWVGYRVVEGEKDWMREERTEIGQWDTLRDAKAALS